MEALGLVPTDEIMAMMIQEADKEGLAPERIWYVRPDILISVPEDSLFMQFGYLVMPTAYKCEREITLCELTDVVGKDGYLASRCIWMSPAGVMLQRTWDLTGVEYE